MSKVNNYIKKKSAESETWRLGFEEESRKLELSVLMMKLREATGLDQAQFAKLVGQSQTLINEIEHAQINPSDDFMNEIAVKVSQKSQA